MNDHLRDNPSVRAATTGGFFYLVDRASGQPRHLALNLMMSGSRIHSMPVRDQETVVASDKGISTHQLQSIGVMSINGKELDWSGAATEHDTAVKIYGNGNSVIRHIPDSQTVTARALDESSRFTPQIRTDDQVDIGFVGRPDGKFTGVTSRRDGGVDIFEHDFVARCTAGIDTTSPIAEVHTIDSLVLSPGIKGDLVPARCLILQTSFNTQSTLICRLAATHRCRIDHLPEQYFLKTKMA